MDKSLENFLLSQKYSENTKSQYHRLLTDLLATQDIDTLTPANLLAWISRPKWGDSMRWTALCAARSFIRWGWGDTHPALILHIKRGKSSPQRTLRPKEITALISHFNTMSTKGIRDLAACCLMLDSGLRLSEICRLEIEHTNLSERYAWVICKGGNWGKAIFSKDTAHWLETWLTIRKASPDVGQFFVSLQGKRKGKSLTRDGFRVTVRRWGIASGIGKLSPHDLRRTYATIATKAGAPTRIVQVGGRWSNIEMVELYTRDMALDADEFDPWFPISRAMSTT